MSSLSAMNFNPKWEQELNLQQGKTIDSLVTLLLAAKEEHGNIKVCFSNYLEENTVAGVTGLRIDKNSVILFSDDEVEEIPTDEEKEHDVELLTKQV